jgi:hypothetical protein
VELPLLAGHLQDDHFLHDKIVRLGKRSFHTTQGRFVEGQAGELSDL